MVEGGEMTAVDSSHGSCAGGGGTTSSDGS